MNREKIITSQESDRNFIPIGIILRSKIKERLCQYKSTQSTNQPNQLINSTNHQPTPKVFSIERLAASATPPLLLEATPVKRSLRSAGALSTT